MRADSPTPLGDYLTVKKDAAGLLGVCPDTLRSWDRAEGLKAVRHPRNGYRLDRREDLDTFQRPTARDQRRPGR